MKVRIIKDGDWYYPQYRGFLWVWQYYDRADGVVGFKTLEEATRFFHVLRLKMLGAGTKVIWTSDIL